MRKLACTVAALALAALVAGRAQADPAGDFIGLVAEPSHPVKVGIQVRRVPGGYQGDYRAISLQFRPAPMTALRTGGAPAFEARSPVGELRLDWNASAGDWRGVWRDRRGVWPTTLRRGAIPPLPQIARVDVIALAGAAVLMLLEAAGIAHLLQLRRRRLLGKTGPRLDPTSRGARAGST